ncbi:MAG TPA: glycosyltransferase family 2 protein [Euzebyales bacterium]
MVDDRVNAVMITRNRAADAAESVAALRDLPERPHVIVVDNGSTDGTTAAVHARRPDVRVITLDHNRGSAGRTVGARAATSPYVAFCDDDTAWRPGALRRAADLLDAHPTLAVVAAHVRVGDDGRDDPVSGAMAGSPLPRVPGLPGVPVLGFLAGMSIVRRDAYLSVGGFVLRDGVGGEEAWLAADLAAAGWHLAYVPDVVAHHRPSTRRDSVRRRRGDLRNALLFAWSRHRGAEAVDATARVLRTAPRDLDGLVGLVGALRSAGWVRRHRRPLPEDVVSSLHLLQATAT